VAVDHVRHLEAGQADLVDALELVVIVIPLDALLGMNMSEHAIATALADVEGLAVSGVDQPVDVRLQLGRHLG
jgi:hypothetical protein